MPTRLPAVLLLAAALAVGGCVAAAGPGTAPTGQAGGGAATAPPAAGEIDPARLEPLAGLPACEPPATPDVAVEVPDALPLPDGAVVLAASPSGGLVQVQGWVPLTPVELMTAYLEVDGWVTRQAEDEVFEAEVLLSDGTRRLYVKGQAVCDRGSAFVAFIGEDAAVPTPTGTVTP